MATTTCPGIDHPEHYTSGGVEAIDFIDAKELNFNLGNVVKYVARCGRKKSKKMSIEAKALEDLKKARWYLDHEIKLREAKMK